MLPTFSEPETLLECSFTAALVLQNDRLSANIGVDAYLGMSEMNNKNINNNDNNRITPFRKSRISTFRVLCCKQGRNAGPEPELELPQLRKSFGTCKGCRSLSREPNGDFLRGKQTRNLQIAYRTSQKNISKSFQFLTEKKDEVHSDFGCFFRDLPKHSETFPGQQCLILRLALGGRSTLGI